MRRPYLDEIDKLELHVERALETEDLTKLRKHCWSADQRPIKVDYHRRWTCCVWVTRPTGRCLKLVRKLLKRAANGYKVYLVELARDFLIASDRARTALGGVLVRGLAIRRRALQVKYWKGTFYWGWRGPLSVALYMDREKKGAGAASTPCVHVELRVRGTAQLRRFGLQTLAQLLAPDFDAVWSSSVDFIEVPRKKTTLGRLLGKRDVSGTALRKRADAFLTRGKVVNAEEIFAVQNAKVKCSQDGCIERLHLPRTLAKLDFNEWCRGLEETTLI